MEEMFRGTTPTLTFEYTNKAGTQVIDLSTYTVHLSIFDGMTLITFANDRITFNVDHSFSITLTQAETLSLRNVLLEIQLRAVKEGVAIASDKAEATLKDILEGGVITEPVVGGE